MLVLSRKQKQQIRIGDDVVITVLQIKGGSVRVGIEAPREVHVMRGELEDFRDTKPVPARDIPARDIPTRGIAVHGVAVHGVAVDGVPAPEGNDILAMTASATTETSTDDENEQEPSSPAECKQRILELKFQGGSDDESQPTRLAEIAESIPSLNLPR